MLSVFKNFIGLLISIASFFLLLIITDYLTPILVVLIPCSICIFIIRLYTGFFPKKDKVITNTEFHADFKTNINEDTEEITLCSSNYSKNSGIVWVTSCNFIKIIDSNKSVIIPLSKIQKVELQRNKDSLASTLSLYSYVIKQNDASGNGTWGIENINVSDRIAFIIFSNGDYKIAEAIHERIKNKS
jgi:hypothetical protein